MRPFARIAAAVLPLAFLAGFAASPASAGCHLVDCVDDVAVKKSEITGMSCPELWLLRNSIYDDLGYCFTSARGQEHFFNGDCTVKDLKNVKLPAVQRKNVALFKKVEAAKGCS